MKEHQYYDLSLCDIFEDLSSGVVSLDSSPITFSSSLDLAFDDSFQTELTNAFLPGPVSSPSCSSLSCLFIYFIIRSTSLLKLFLLQTTKVTLRTYFLN